MKVGFIGLGNVGGKLSGSLLRNGIDLTVHDLNEDLVAEFVAKGAAGRRKPRPTDARLRCGDHLPAVACSLGRGHAGDAARGFHWQNLDGNVDH